MPSLPEGAFELFVTHLKRVFQFTDTRAKEAVNYFKHKVERAAFELMLSTISVANKIGVYMRLLNSPDHVILVYPYIAFMVGDEPGLKRMLSMKEGGNTKHFCIHCLYHNGGGFTILPYM